MSSVTRHRSAPFFVALLLSACASDGESRLATGQSGLVESMPVYGIPLFDTVLPDTELGPADEIASVALVATPGETEPATFVLLPDRDLFDVGAELSPAVGMGSISPAWVDIRVVKVWPQGDITSNKTGSGEPVCVPELLVYDDLEELTSLDEEGEYQPPTIATELRTDILADRAKQFWITVRVPDGTTAGQYTAMLTITVGGVGVRQLPMSLTVLPFALHEPRHRYIATHDPDPSEPNAVEMIDDILAHGLHGVKIRVDDPTADPLQLLRDRLSFTSTLGMNGPIHVDLSSEADPDGVQVMEQLGYEPLLQPLDEPGLDDLEEAATYISDSHGIHEANGATVVGTTREFVEALAYPDPGCGQPECDLYSLPNPEAPGLSFRQSGITDERPEVPTYSVVGIDGYDNGERDNDAFFRHVEALQAGAEKDFETEYIYWMGFHERPLLNRMASGNFLWTSRLDGALVYAYRARILGDAFDDFDDPNGYRDQLITYPAVQGPIPTMQWEALREGIDDIRYLTTLFDLLADLEGTDPSLAEAIRGDVEAHLLLYHDLRDHGMRVGADFEATRAFIIEQIERVLAAL